MFKIRKSKEVTVNKNKYIDFNQTCQLSKLVGKDSFLRRKFSNSSIQSGVIFKLVV